MYKDMKKEKELAKVVKLIDKQYHIEDAIQLKEMAALFQGLAL